MQIFTEKIACEKFVIFLAIEEVQLDMPTNTCVHLYIYKFCKTTATFPTLNSHTVNQYNQTDLFMTPCTHTYTSTKTYLQTHYILM